MSGNEEKEEDNPPSPTVRNIPTAQPDVPRHSAPIVPPTTRANASKTPAPTRLAQGALPTRLDLGIDAEAASPPRIRLPQVLATRYRILRQLPTHGAEADIYVVESIDGKERRAVKLYRLGVAPKTEVLARITQGMPEHVVRLYDYGQSEDCWYEVLEYAEHGTLGDMLKRGEPLSPDLVRSILLELHDALAHLHEKTVEGQQLIHRDIKPENILVRTRDPLDLILADFGIASIIEASQHFSTLSRTVKYGAPEAAHGKVGTATDYWALGLILLEALTGRHPFDGLSQEVINYQIATQPIDISELPPPWRLLCQGLLIRNDKKRWGRAEIDRWLDGDGTLAVSTDDYVAVLGGISPYKFGDKECRTQAELAAALAGNWAAAVKDLGRGLVEKWLLNELKDQNLVRALADLNEDRALNPDERLQRFFYHLDPSLPPLWRGIVVDEAGLIGVAREAMQGNEDYGKLVEELYERKVLDYIGQRGSAFHRVVVDNWRQAVAQYEESWKTVISGGVPRTFEPSQQDSLPGLLLLVLVPSFIEQLREQVIGGWSEGARECHWCRSLWDVHTATGPQLLVLQVLAGAPKLVVTPSSLDLGRVRLGVSATATLRIREPDGRPLAGNLRIEPSGCGVAVDPSAIGASSANATVTAIPRGLPVGSTQEVALEIETNGGVLRLPVRYRVGRSWEEVQRIPVEVTKIIALIFAGGIVGSIAGFILGWIPAHIITLFKEGFRSTQYWLFYYAMFERICYVAAVVGAAFGVNVNAKPNLIRNSATGLLGVGLVVLLFTPLSYFTFTEVVQKEIAAVQKENASREALHRKSVAMRDQGTDIVRRFFARGALIKGIYEPDSRSAAFQVTITGEVSLSPSRSDPYDQSFQVVGHMEWPGGEPRGIFTSSGADGEDKENDGIFHGNVIVKRNGEQREQRELRVDTFFTVKDGGSYTQRSKSVWNGKEFVPLERGSNRYYRD